MSKQKNLIVLKFLKVLFVLMTIFLTIGFFYYLGEFLTDNFPKPIIENRIFEIMYAALSFILFIIYYFISAFVTLALVLNIFVRDPASGKKDEFGIFIPKIKENINLNFRDILGVLILLVVGIPVFSIIFFIYEKFASIFDAVEGPLIFLVLFIKVMFWVFIPMFIWVIGAFVYKRYDKLKK